MKNQAKKLIISLILTLAATTSAFAMSYDEAKVQDKPIVIMFHQHGCSACRKFSSIFGKISSKFSDKFNFVKEDVSNSKIASQIDSTSLHFETVPALFIVEPKTQKTTRISNECSWNNECLSKTLQEYNNK